MSRKQDKGRKNIDITTPKKEENVSNTKQRIRARKRQSA